MLFFWSVASQTIPAQTGIFWKFLILKTFSNCLKFYFQFRGSWIIVKRSHIIAKKKFEVEISFWTPSRFITVETGTRRSMDVRYTLYCRSIADLSHELEFCSWFHLVSLFPPLFSVTWKDQRMKNLFQRENPRHVQTWNLFVNIQISSFPSKFLIIFRPLANCKVISFCTTILRFSVM